MAGRKNKFSQIITTSTLLLTTGLLVVACGNKGGDSAPAPTVVQPWVNPTCLGAGTNCITGGGAELYRGDSTGGWYGSGTQLSLVFQATQYSAGAVTPGYNNGYNGYPNTLNYPNYPNYNNSLSPGTYSGGVTVQGTLNVTQNGWTGVLLPTGSYQIVSMQQGTWMNATYQNVKVQIVSTLGGITAVATLSGIVGAKSSNYWGWTWQEIPRQGTVMGQIVFESINGQPYYNVMNY